MQSRNPTTSRGGIFCCRLPYYTRRSAAGRFVGSGLDRSAGRQKNASLPYCVCRGDHWSPANLPPQRIFRDSCLVRQAGTGEQCSPLQEFSPVWARNIPARRTVLSPTACGRSPLAEGAKRGRVFACCACKRIYLRFRLVKNHLMWYTISLQVHRQTRCKPATQSYRGPSGQPVANKKLLFYCRR